jgi:hypothetical protein
VGTQCSGDDLLYSITADEKLEVVYYRMASTFMDKYHLVDPDLRAAWPPNDWRTLLCTNAMNTRLLRGVDSSWVDICFSPFESLNVKYPTYNGVYDFDCDIWGGPYDECVHELGERPANFSRERLSIGVNVCCTDFIPSGDAHALSQPRNEWDWRRRWPIQFCLVADLQVVLEECDIEIPDADYSIVYNDNDAATDDDPYDLGPPDGVFDDLLSFQDFMDDIGGYSSDYNDEV